MLWFDLISLIGQLAKTFIMCVLADVLIVKSLCSVGPITEISGAFVDCCAFVTYVTTHSKAFGKGNI